MNNLNYIGYGFGLTVTILLLATIFAFNYHSSIEKEYFSNYIKLNKEILSP